MQLDQKKLIRRAHAFGYDIQNTRNGWVLTRDGRGITFKNLVGVRDFLNNQYLR